MTTKTETLQQLTEAERTAQEIAQKAAADAEAARQRAEEARQRAEEQRAAANLAYLEKLQSEHAEARNQALERQAETRATFEAIVRGETKGDVFAAYRAWMEARVHVWEVEQALNSMRQIHGRPYQEAKDPTFSFQHDVNDILTKLGYQLQDQAIERIRERRRAFLEGKDVA